MDGPRGADLALLTEIAREAGEAARRFFGRAPEAWEKPGGAGPVSEADLAADRLLKARLIGARPDYGWLSEETPDAPERLSRERIFVVDPIDGTRAFLAGEPGWCVAAAVIEGGAPVAAVAWFPILGLLYAAAAGAGATRDGAPIRPSARASLAGGVAYGNKSQLGPARFPGGAPEMRRAFRPSMVHRLCLVAEGEGEAAVTFNPVWEWDAAAGALIAAEAGCAVSDGAGAAPVFNAPHPRLAGLIVAPPALHADLMARAAPAGA